MINTIKEWTASKDTNDFNYNEALKTLIKNKTIHNQSIEKYLHLNDSNSEIEKKFEGISNLNKCYIKDVLELINIYTYYLNMNKIIDSKDDKNIKKLKQLSQILDSDFIEFLDRYLDLDKTVTLNPDGGLWIKHNFKGVVKYYLQHSFKFAINTLKAYFEKNKIGKNAIELKDKELTNSLLLKVQTNAFLKPISIRGILKCLYFDLLYNFEDITKEQSINIIEEFFNITLEDKKIEHTLSIKAIVFIKEHEENLFKLVYDFYKYEFDKEGKIIKKNIPKYIEEIKKVFNLKTYINDNFTPIITTHHK